MWSLYKVRSESNIHFRIGATWVGAVAGILVWEHSYTQYVSSYGKVSYCPYAVYIVLKNVAIALALIRGGSVIRFLFVKIDLPIEIYCQVFGVMLKK